MFFKQTFQQTGKFGANFSQSHYLTCFKPSFRLLETIFIPKTNLNYCFFYKYKQKDLTGKFCCMDSPQSSISSSQEMMESPPRKCAVNLEDSGLGEIDLNVSWRDPSQVKMASLINTNLSLSTVLSCCRLMKTFARICITIKLADFFLCLRSLCLLTKFITVSVSVHFTINSFGKFHFLYYNRYTNKMYWDIYRQLKNGQTSFV